MGVQHSFSNYRRPITLYGTYAFANDHGHPKKKPVAHKIKGHGPDKTSKNNDPFHMRG